MPPAVLDAPVKTARRSYAGVPGPRADRPQPSPAGSPLTTAADYRFPRTGRVARTVVLHTADGPVEVPGLTAEWDAFRPWVLSDECPPHTRFTFLGDRYEIDPVPESVNAHGAPKSRIAAVVCGRVYADDLGYCGIVGTRLVDDGLGLSCEPDFLVVNYETSESGRVTFTPKANRPDDHVELVGTADLVGEILSDSSTAKDRGSEPPLLFAAGVREFWRADCRGDRCEFEILARGPADWEPVAADADGFFRSGVLGKQYRLTRLAPRAGFARYRFEERD